MTQRSPGNGSDWNATIAAATDHVDESDLQAADARARSEREGRSPGAYVLAALPVLLAVVAWNVWVVTRPPEVPPDADIAFALRENAGALAREVVALRDQQGRLPTPAELGDALDEELTYELRGEGFVIGNTDGVIQVRYDGSWPVDEWVASGGFARVGGGR